MNCLLCEQPRLRYSRGLGWITQPYCRDHWGFRSSMSKPKATATRTVVKAGYAYLRCHTNGNRHWDGEHRVVMEETLERRLRAGESVHHKNGDRLDNRPENLELWVAPIRYGQRAGDLTCPHCGKSYRATEEILND